MTEINNVRDFYHIGSSLLPKYGEDRNGDRKIDTWEATRVDNSKFAEVASASKGEDGDRESPSISYLDALTQAGYTVSQEVLDHVKGVRVFMDVTMENPNVFSREHHPTVKIWVRVRDGKIEVGKDDYSKYGKIRCSTRIEVTRDTDVKNVRAYPLTQAYSDFVDEEKEGEGLNLFGGTNNLEREAMNLLLNMVNELGDKQGVAERLNSAESELRGLEEQIESLESILEELEAMAKFGHLIDKR